MDETGLFFRSLPDKSLFIRGEDCKGGKKSKDRITLVLCCNMEGHFEKPLVIGKAAKPRCFRNISVDQLPVIWRSNKKAWMTGQLFTEWVTDLDRRMRLARRNILLFLDNAPSHPTLKLTNVKLAFFPVNTTSVLQPLDQGIIQAVKMVYRKRLLRATLARLGDGNVQADEVSKGVSVLDAIRFVSGAVKEVRKETVVKCFAKGGISVNDVEVPDADDDTPLSELRDMLCAARERIPCGMTAEQYVECDSDAPSREVLEAGWEDNLIRDTLSRDNQHLDDEPEVNASQDDNQREDPEDNPIKTAQEALRCIKQLQGFSAKKGFQNLLNIFNSAEDCMEELAIDIQCLARQSTIDSFFSR